MKKLLKSILLTFLLASTVCFTQKVAAQPTFTAPVTCIPADPAQPTTTYTLVPSAGDTITSITPFGDLQILSVTPALPTTATVIIVARSLNRGRNVNNDCIHFLAGSNSQNFGFGRGVIRVGYRNGRGCGQSLDQVINKTFTQTPPIVGPTCISPGDTVTYSVCSILSVNLNENIGQDVYVWNSGTVPPGLSEVYRSGDGSSVTYVVSTTPGAYTGATLTCQFGQCNLGRISSLVLGLKTQPSVVKINLAIVAPNSSKCIRTDSTPISLVATQPAGATYTYSWSTNNSSWTFGAGTATATSNSGFAVSLNANESGGAVYLKTLGGCNVRIDTFYINRTLFSPLTIKRLDTVSCLTPGTPITLYVDNSAGNATLSNLSFTWSFVAPANGWTFSGGTSGPSVNSIAVTGNVTVQVTSVGCTTNTLTLPLNIKPAKPVLFNNVEWNACYPQGSTTPITYAVNNVSPLTYTWSNTGTGWSGASTTSSITYTPIATATPGIVSVRAYNRACYSDSLRRVISYTPTAPTGITVSNCIPGGVASTVTLTATGGSGGYVWTIPAGLGTVASSTANSVTINTTGTTNLAGYAVSVKCSNSCGTSTSFSLNVPIQNVATINYSQNFNSDQLTVNSPCVASNYCWKLNNTGACVGGNVASITLNMGGAASYTVYITYPSGGVLALTQATRYTSRSANGNGKKDLAIAKSGTYKVNISPNPAKNSFTLALPANLANASVSVYNSKGALMQKKTCKGGTNSFSTANWANGEYVLKITNSQGETVSKKVVVYK